MLRPGRKCFGGFIAVALAYILLTGLVASLNKGNANLQEKRENIAWISTSRNWLDRQLCRWIGACGTAHLNQNGWTWDGAEDDFPPALPDRSDWWTSGPEDADDWTPEEQAQRKVPQYVLDYAPYVHLFSGEQYWPCDLGEHIIHTSARVNYTKILDLEYDSNLTNLHELNGYEGGRHGKYLYLQSDDNVEEHPDWLGGSKNIPRTPEVLTGADKDEVWPSLDGLEVIDLESAKQQALAEHAPPPGTDDAGEPFWSWPTQTPSPNGRCGGGTGFTCKGANFGSCCSIYGWCGGGDEYCGDPCDPLAGDCNDPFEPVPRPKQDLRKRTLAERSEKYRPNQALKSTAPAFLIVVPKEDGVVDAFWFFFYSFNLGQKVLNVRFGNHVGDWEHTLVRFKHGEPQSVFLSEHNFGDAYAYQALEKYLPNPDGSGTMIGTWSNNTASKMAKRPVVYSAIGSHAMYASPGLHPYVLPWGLLHDQTDRGPLWDPTLNLRSYIWTPRSQKLRSSNLNPKAPTEWFHYAGHWGDKYYPLSDPRQYRFAGQYHYVNGPSGPKFKNLARRKVCQAPGGRCNIRHWIGGDRARRLPPEEDSEEGGLPGGNFTSDAEGSMMMSGRHH